MGEADAGDVPRISAGDVVVLILIGIVDRVGGGEGGGGNDARHAGKVSNETIDRKVVDIERQG